MNIHQRKSYASVLEMVRDISDPEFAAAFAAAFAADMEARSAITSLVVRRVVLGMTVVQAAQRMGVDASWLEATEGVIDGLVGVVMLEVYDQMLAEAERMAGGEVGA